MASKYLWILLKSIFFQFSIFVKVYFLKIRERDFYYDIYESLYRFVESTRENKYELSQVLYPIFIHLYIDMINKDYLKLAQEFFTKYSSSQTSNHALDIKKLKLITNKDQLSRSEFRETYGSTKYNVKLSDESYRLLKDFVKVKNSKPLVDLIKENMMLESNLKIIS